MERAASKSAKLYKTPLVRTQSVLNLYNGKSPESRSLTSFKHIACHGSIKKKNQTLLLTKEKTYGFSKSDKIIYDKEFLYHELHLAKRFINEIKEENLKLKTQLRITEKESMKRTCQLKDALDGIPLLKGKMETRLEIDLKQRIKELKKEITKIENEYLNFKKNIATTRTQELVSEVRIFYNECERLKKIGKRLVSKNSISPEEIETIERKIHEQSSVIRNLKQDNESLLTMIKERDKEISELKIKLDKFVIKNNKLFLNKKTVLKQKKVINDQCKIIEYLREQIRLINIEPKDDEVNLLRNRITELIKTKEELKENLEAKIKEVKKLKVKKTRYECYSKKNNQYELEYKDNSIDEIRRIIQELKLRLQIDRKSVV